MVSTFFLCHHTSYTTFLSLSIVTDKINSFSFISYRPHITKQEAARRMQMSQPTYLRYESGERTPSIHVIQVMADVLNTSVSYLIGQTDNPNPDSYLIKLDTEPELFLFIEKYKSSDTDMRNRLLSYLQKHTE